MKGHKISAVLVYCTKEQQFLEECIQSLIPFCDKIVVPITARLWNGKKDNVELLKQAIKIIEKYDKCEIVYYSINSNFTYWENEEYCRKQGIYALAYSGTEHIIFVDVDEIADSNRFIEWLDEGHYKNYDTIQLKTYWYWRERKYRSLQYPNGPITLMNIKAAWDWYNSKAKVKGRALIGNTLIGAFHKDGKPMIHHYSWVRDKEGFYLKTKSWGELEDSGHKDWENLYNEEMSREFNGKDFVHGYEYEFLEK